MKMNNKAALILIILAMFLFAPGMMAQKVDSYQCKWNPGLPVGDEESLINRMQYEEKSKFMFLLSNDGEKLYIDLVLSDPAAVQKIMRFGLTTWLNRDAKAKKGTGVVFPRVPDGSSEPMFRKNKNGSDKKEIMKAMMEKKNREMELIGFEGKGVRTIIDPGIDPDFDGKIEMKEGGKIHISLAIALAKLGRGSTSDNFSPISAGFETGYLDVTGQGMPSGGGQMGGDMHGGGMPGGGHSGGGPPTSGGSMGAAESGQGQQQPDISRMTSPSKMWIKVVHLAEKP